MTNFNWEPYVEPGPRKSVCELCGKSFIELSWAHDDRLVPFCYECMYEGRRYRGNQQGMAFTQRNDIECLGAAPVALPKLLYRQTVQISIAMVALEDECKTRR